VIKEHLRRYKYYFLVPFCLIILIAALLMILSGGPQLTPFIYQVR